MLILHGTNRAGRVFLVPSFAGVLFGPGQLLDASKYYLILPDQLGAGMGKSTKPSDGLRAKFPHYDYSDMVRASQLLVKEGLQVNHVHLFIGTSMGCMEGFMWGESNPSDVDAMLLLSCLPVEIASRNRMVRKMMIDDIRKDPGWNNGNYTQQPYGLRAALGHLLVVGSAPVYWQKEYPTAALADKYVDEYIEENMKTTDANDFMYQYDASRNYDASKDLGKITRESAAHQFSGGFLESRGTRHRGAGNQESEKWEICAAAVRRSIARPLHVFPGRVLAEPSRRVPQGFEELT